MSADQSTMAGTLAVPSVENFSETEEVDEDEWTTDIA